MIEDKNQKVAKKFKFTKDMLNKGGIQLTEKQNKYYRSIRDNTLTICQGPSGTAKTFTACYTALALLADKKIEKIILTKPLQTSGEDVGFLKGSLDEKVLPFVQSYFTNFIKIIGKQTFQNLIDAELIQVETLAYMRGSTYDNSLMMIDEVQNGTMSQIMLWITRLGKDSKAVMMGDISQYDIKKKDSKFLEFIELVDGIKGTSMVKFDSSDIVRNKFLIEVVDRYEKYKAENDI